VTKGNPAEQRRKVEHSGLLGHFSAVEVVAEKEITVYQTIVSRYELHQTRTWMVGNSPKSDINPALGAGINAVFVPHDDTWVLEHEELAEPRPPSRLLVLQNFGQLMNHF
jgi:putative hydrolase of the HAD superfamily